MEYRHLTPTDYVVSCWSGGKTIQLAISPPGAIYAERDFLWRLSSATADIEESDYTALPDYHRWIATLEGEIRLQHDGGEIVTLRPYERHEFEGGANTHSWGRCTDFNLMLRHGRAEGELEAIFPEGKTKKLSLCGADTALLYCGEGGGRVRLGESVVELQKDESLLLRAFAEEESLLLSGEGRFLLAKVRT